MDFYENYNCSKMYLNNTNLSSTKVFSKIMCIEAVYPIHIIFAYLIVISGIGAFITRIKWKHLHSFFGLSFILCMLWCTGTSLLIFNTGLPRFVIISFLIMGISLTFGLIAIQIHKVKYQRNLSTKIDELASVEKEDLVNKAMRKLAEKPRTWIQRFFSFKSLHGYLMAIAWYQMFGRLVSTNPVKEWHGCFTIPAYKELDGDGNLVPLPEENPDFSIDNEAAFLSAVVIPAVVIFGIIGLFWSILASYRNNSSEDTISSTALEEVKLPS